MKTGDLVKVRNNSVVGLVLQVAGKSVLIENAETNRHELYEADQLFVLKRKLYVDESRGGVQ